MMDQIAATARLTRQMQEAEAASIDALVATTALMHTATLALKGSPDAPRATAHAALLRMHKAVEGLIGVEAELARVHGGLIKVGQETGAFDEPTCPDPQFAFKDEERRVA